MILCDLVLDLEELLSFRMLLLHLLYRHCILGGDVRNLLRAGDNFHMVDSTHTFNSSHSTHASCNTLLVWCNIALPWETCGFKKQSRHFSCLLLDYPFSSFLPSAERTPVCVCIRSTNRLMCGKNRVPDAGKVDAQIRRPIECVPDARTGNHLGPFHSRTWVLL